MHDARGQLCPRIGGGGDGDGKFWPGQARELELVHIDTDGQSSH